MYATSDNLMYKNWKGDSSSVTAVPQFMKNALDEKIVVAKQNLETLESLKEDGPAKQETLAELMDKTLSNSLRRAAYLDQAGKHFTLRHFKVAL